MVTRRSRWFPVQTCRWPESSQTDFLRDDFRLYVVPYRNNQGAYKLSAEGISKRFVGNCLRLDNEQSGVDDFIRSVSARLLDQHEVWLEVAVGEEESSPFGVYAVDWVRRTASGRLIQELPPPDLWPGWVPVPEGWESEISLDEDLMVRVSLPDTYPSDLLLQVAQDLAEIGPGSFPQWALNDILGESGSTSLFDPKLAHRTERLRVAQAALPIGWVGRERLLRSNPTVGEYYFLRRELQFLLFRSAVRERAEEALCQVLRLAGTLYGFTASVSADVVYSVVQVEEFIRRFEAGGLSLSQARDIVFEIANADSFEQRIVF